MAELARVRHRKGARELFPELLAAMVKAKTDLSSDTVGARPSRKPKAKRRHATRPFTKPQIDALDAYVRKGRNVAAAAAELGISRAAAYDRINAGLKKTVDKPSAKRAGKSVRAQALPTDERGQEVVASDD